MVKNLLSVIHAIFDFGQKTNVQQKGMMLKALFTLIAMVHVPA